ncbi:MAG: HAD family hydrolase [Bryobacteraceae bacterium]
MALVPRFPVYLFDVDGTLLDSAADICGAVREVLAGTPHADVPFQVLRSYVGHHLLTLFRDLFPEKTEEEHWALIHDYRAIYPQRGHRLTKPYDGVVETLAALGGKKSTATTKSTETARHVLDRFGLAGHFDHVQGTDGFPSKPEPEVIFRSLRVLEVRPEDCLLVGDAGPDMEAGRRAGVKTCAVRWGYGDQEEMARWSPDYWIEHPSQLLG